METLTINNNLEYRDRLTDSNKKVKGYLFSLPPVKSCLNCDSCKSSCYALKAYKQYPNVKNLWDSNFNLVKNNLKQLERDLTKQLTKISFQKKHKRVVRIHQSGDFYSTKYIKLWLKLAAKFNNILFYGYTKVENYNKEFNTLINQLSSLDNVNIIESFIKGTKRKNYGDFDYCQRVAEKTNAFICPVNKFNENQNIHCGIDRDSKYNRNNATFCDYCFKNNNVVFVQH